MRAFSASISSRLAIVAAVMALAGAAIAPAQAESVYRRGESGDSSSFDPAKTSTVVEGDVLADLFETLVVYDGKAQLQPGAAESWTISDDGLTYAFKLRPGNWSNGDPVKAGDFVFSFRRLVDPATGSPYANLYFPIKNAEAISKGSMKPEELGVTAPDDKTFVVALERATPYMLTVFAHQTASPVSQANVEKFGKDFAKPGNLVTNGAYKLDAFTPNDQTALSRNDFNTRNSRSIAWAEGIKTLAGCLRSTPRHAPRVTKYVGFDMPPCVRTTRVGASPPNQAFR